MQHSVTYTRIGALERVDACTPKEITMDYQLTQHTLTHAFMTKHNYELTQADA